MEFGVGNGKSLAVIHASTTQTVIHGFDSWEGIPEDWEMEDGKVYPKGSFKCDVPRRKPTWELHKGLFEDTIPVWLEKYQGNAALVHIDSDLYSSCKTVLTLLNDRIVPGTLLVFDELYNYPNYEEGEHKALVEWMEEYDRMIVECSMSELAVAIKVIQ